MGKRTKKIPEDYWKSTRKTAESLNKILIISPYFPPYNAADMHRVRQTLPYLEQLGWKPTIVTVDSIYIEGEKDDLLIATLPKDFNLVKVKALPYQITRKIGLGSLALRSIWFYWRTINRVLRKEKFDLIFFSTTQYPLTVLGNYWKKRYGIPYIIDMQDPWHTDYYINKPKSERPTKFWFSYRLNKYLEPIAMRRVDGIISVADAYHEELRSRYPWIKKNNCKTITFGAFEEDMEVVCRESIENNIYIKRNQQFNLVYVGAVGAIMKRSIYLLLRAIKEEIAETPEIKARLKVYFVGTSYAPKGMGQPSVQPIADTLELTEWVYEFTDRIPYFEALKLIKDASVNLIIGSDDPNYSASKLYPYVLAGKPILAIYHNKSNFVPIFKSFNVGELVTFGTKDDNTVIFKIRRAIRHLFSIGDKPKYQLNKSEFQSYTAYYKAKEQTQFFNQVIRSSKN